MLSILQRIIQEVYAAATLEEALGRVVCQVRDVINADACSFFWCDDVEGEYVLTATIGREADLIGKVRFKYGEGLIGVVAERTEPININHAPEHPAFRTATKHDPIIYKAFLGVPVVERGELIGILMAERAFAEAFTEDNEAFCVTLAVQLSEPLAEARARGMFASAMMGRRRRRRREIILPGIPGASGIVLGTAVVVFPPADLDGVPDRFIEDQSAEIRAFEDALMAAREDIQMIQSRARSTLSVPEQAIFDAYLRILDSRSLMNEVVTVIKSGQWAQGALKRVIKRHVLQFESLSDPYLKERAADFRDLGRRVLAHLQSIEKKSQVYPKNTILVGEEVTATSIMEVPEGQLKAIISASGGPYSHVAILARALGLPAVMGVTGIPLLDLQERDCIVDGYNGHVYVMPSAELKKELRLLIEEEESLDDELEKLRDLPAQTQDGHRLSLYVNTGLALEGHISLRVGAEGVGLYRTELPFMVRERFPSEEEQRVMYRQLLHTFYPRPVVMRTLDIGGDKALPYFFTEEENPVLGWRGIRVILDHPEIFLQQVRAMLQASEGLQNLSILLPMIASVGEVEMAMRFIHQAYHEVCEEGFKIVKPQVGIMVEVPAAVYQTPELAKRVDFLSVGSNDLIQYLLAVDRNNPRVADRYDGLHPAVLRAFKQVVTGAHKVGRRVSICGEMAGDPIAIVLLLALGFDALSMNARSLPRVKWVIRSFSMEKARDVLDEVMKMDDAKDVRLYMEFILEEAGLGGLLRAGR